MTESRSPEAIRSSSFIAAGRKLSTKKGRVMGACAAPDVVRAGPPDLREGG